MNVKKIVAIEEQLNITGARLLFDDEAELLPQHAMDYPDNWWLRTIEEESDRACAVYFDEDYEANIYWFSKSSLFCVRPALVLSDISNTNFKVGDIFEISGYQFEIISNSLAWMHNDDIGKHCFDEKNNDYEKSLIKKFVDNWFKNLSKKESK